MAPSASICLVDSVDCVRREVVHVHHVVGLESRRQYLLYVGAERFPVHQAGDCPITCVSELGGS